jgi:hypothetical protein
VLVSVKKNKHIFELRFRQDCTRAKVETLNI